ncbi:MAG: hypothetical protein R3F39_12200 [Myxococcota bacterium]
MTRTPTALLPSLLVSLALALSACASESQGAGADATTDGDSAQQDGADSRSDADAVSPDAETGPTAPPFGTCADDPLATAEGLADKAARFDAIAARLHLNPALGWVMDVTLRPGADEATATYADVQAWHTGENDGLWSGLYMASQAFRYAVTRDADALRNLEVLMASERDRMRITGVPGVFTRQLIPPDVPGIACPTDDAAYTTDVEKDDNRWVRIDAAGCATVVDHTTSQWKTTEHCGLEAYAGWCFLDNVSQDEYAGHMLALGAIWRLVDEPKLKQAAADLLESVGVHLMENHLAFVDWDGRVTEHGKLWATSFAGTPGFLAAESLGFIRLAADASGREDLDRFYYDCLLQQAGPEPCLPHALETGDPYTSYLPFMAVLTEPDGCKSNYNNLSMVMTWLFDLALVEDDPAVRGPALKALDEEIFRAPNVRNLEAQKNSWFTFMWAAMHRLGPEAADADRVAIETAVCGLRQFPASKAVPTRDPSATYPHDCDGRLGGSQAATPIPVAERCPRTFLWWGSPYDRGGCTANSQHILQPADYLLAYWMGRYYGFVPEGI